jgi:pimeloyl-ACP methyl ester carboxylesterase
VLVLEGADSDINGIIDLKKAASTFPQGRFQRVADAGHLLVMEKPQEVLAIIADFLAGV